MSGQQELARDWHMREVAHYNGGKEWFGYGHQCVEQPRLYRLDKYIRKDRSTQSIWSVDGETCADFAEALERLETPPVATDAELALLAKMSSEWRPLREERERLKPDGFMDVYYGLSRKGLIEARDGQMRLTESGAALKVQP